MSRIVVDAAYEEAEESYLTKLDEALEHADRVVSVDLSGNKISHSTCTDIAWKYLSHFVRLEELDIKANQMGTAGWKSLYETIASTCPQTLRHLDISENAVQDEGMYCVAKLLTEAPQLRYLSLITNCITPRGLPTLCDGLIYAASLEELYLDYNGLGDEGTSIVCAALTALPKLRKLGLSDNSIGEKGACAIAATILSNSKSTVRWLNLACNKLGDGGLAILGSTLAADCSTRALRNLDVSCNSNVTFAGNAEFARTVAKWRSVRSLELCSMNLAAADVEVLIAAIRDPTASLVYLEYFNNPGLPRDVEDDLRAAMDTCAKYSSDDQQQDDDAEDATAPGTRDTTRAGAAPFRLRTVSIALVALAVAAAVGCGIMRSRHRR